MNAPCPPPRLPPVIPNQSGPDARTTICWPPQGCCLPGPCKVTEWEFLCAIRSLLPEGEIFNNVLPTQKDPPEFIGVITVGCARIGCEQLILGSCCSDFPPCTDEPIAPQLAVVDAYAATAYRVLQALCNLVRELDPCTAVVTRRKWAERLGLISDDLCEPQFSDDVLAQLLCIWPSLRGRIWNWATLQEIAARFGASITLREAGDMNCDEAFANGWWTMARDRADCPTIDACPPSAKPPYLPPILDLHPGCEKLPLSINLILSPSDIQIPDNCALPGDKVLPHDPDLYEAFKKLLPRILPQPAFYCVYDSDPANCIQ